MISHETLLAFGKGAQSHLAVIVVEFVSSIVDVPHALTVSSLVLAPKKRSSDFDVFTAVIVAVADVAPEIVMVPR